MISSYTVGAAQADGRSYIKERHLLADGRSVDFEYLADLATIDPEQVMQARAVRVQAEINVREASLALAQTGVVSWTKLQFERRFSDAEWAAIQDFNAGHEALPYLTPEQKLAIRRGLSEYGIALDVSPADGGTISLVGLYEALGLIAAGRAAEILNG